MTKRKTNTPTMDAILAIAAKAKGSQREQAEALGLPLATFQRYLNGARPKALVDLDRMAKALGLVVVVMDRASLDN